MRGRLIDLSFGRNGRQRVTVEVDRDFREKFDKLKDVELDVEIKKHRNRRSLDANAYFHVLVDKIASELGEKKDITKKRLVLEYGTLDYDEYGEPSQFIVLASIDPERYYPYCKFITFHEVDGKMYHSYMVYKQTHLMNTKEMARLIDGAIEDAKELGIETDTPEQIARYKALWQA